MRSRPRFGFARGIASGAPPLSRTANMHVDGFVSLGVIASAAVVGLGLPIADPIIGLIITLVILRITWDSWQTVRSAEIEIDHFEARGDQVVVDDDQIDVG